MEDSRAIPPDIRSVAVFPFENRSAEPGLENMLTDEVIQQFLADGQLKVVDRDEADVYILGTVRQYRRIPLIYSENDIVQQYKVRISVDLKLVDPETEKVLREQRDIYRETTYSDQLAPLETEYDAQQRVIIQLSRDVVTTTVEGWPYLKT
ncbi:MAG: LPS assembly lipoprotein LptE [bacterium]